MITKINLKNHANVLVWNQASLANQLVSHEHVEVIFHVVIHPVNVVKEVYKNPIIHEQDHNYTLHQDAGAVTFL